MTRYVRSAAAGVSAQMVRPSHAPRPQKHNSGLLRPMSTAAGHHTAVLAAKTGPQYEGSDAGIKALMSWPPHVSDLQDLT